MWQNTTNSPVDRQFLLTFTSSTFYNGTGSHGPAVRDPEGIIEVMLDGNPSLMSPFEVDPVAAFKKPLSTLVSGDTFPRWLLRFIP